MGHTEIWAFASREVEDSEDRADSETVCVLKGVDRRVMPKSPGSKWIQSLFTENACKSPMHLAEARARRNALWEIAPSYQWMIKSRVVAVKELLTPPLGPRAGLKEGAGMQFLAPLWKLIEAPSSLIMHNTSGNTLIGGNTYSLAAGQCDVSAPPFNREWDREKNSRQCTFSFMANRSTSAVP